MANRLIQKNLVNNAISAYYAAIEIHNKPHFAYRYESVSILIINAWELILKAFVRKYVKGKCIYRKNEETGEQETLPLRIIIKYCQEYLNSQDKNNFFKATSMSIIEIEKYRDNSIHFYNENIEPILFALIAKNAYDFPRFIKDYFNKDIIAIENVHILPIGFKLPFNPLEYFKSNYSNPSKSKEVREFINSLIAVSKELDDEGVEESILIGFNVTFESVKKVRNSDFVAAITDVDSSDISISLTKTIRLSDDNSAQSVNVSTKQFYDIYTVGYNQLIDNCHKRYKDFIAGKKFNGHLAEMKKNLRYAGTLGRPPQSKIKTPPQYLYSKYWTEFFDNHYEINIINDQTTKTI